jgi:hypothetical protein
VRRERGEREERERRERGERGERERERERERACTHVSAENGLKQLILVYIHMSKLIMKRY